MMKKLAVLAVLVGLMSITPSVSIASPPPERCPRIHEAIHALEVAQEELEKAGHDFCGHKAEAMEANRHAIEQLRKAEECDRCRGEHR